MPHVHINVFVFWETSVSQRHLSVSSDLIELPASTLSLGPFSVGYLNIMNGELHKERLIWLLVLKVGKFTHGWWLLRRYFLVVGGSVEL